MADESIQERQDNELEALKAIYGGQLQETPRTKGTKGWRPLDIVLSLGPQQGSVLQETHTCLDLHIICGNDYPNTVPKITVVKSKGLTIHQLNILVQNLNKKADTLKGEVMVFELATMVQTYLHQYNRPGFQSLYDEMFSRQLKEQQKEEEQKKVLEDKMRQEVLLETQNKKEALKQEQRWRRNSEIVKEEEDDFLPRTQTERQPVFKKPLLTADLLDNDDSNEMKQADSSIDDFTPWTHSPQGVSRLKNEFEVLQFVGKGAFGDVLKVRNKLDRCLYAIKRIELNPMNKLLYKKITREVKLLSRLNHENVVRYFNSWIETDSPDNISCTSQAEKVEKVAHKVVDMLPINDVSVEWDLSKHDQDSSDDSSDDNCWITFLSQSSETTGKTLDIENSQTHESISSTEDNRSENVVSATQQFMYIQMEFCEKSTLRTAIDNGLYKDENRVWRLLREIVEGLSHIHEQGIIHRDLKPVNIFIDSEDHVKIGDFGLATTNILHKAGAVVEQIEPLANHSHGLSVGDISHTGQVGTALYVAPELNTCCIKATYNQKVDIYSLGVIFFEMCYNPLFTHMERIKVLADLRSDECQLPADFVDDSKLSKTRLLRWMLLHDPLQRPSSEELLQSELLPPPQFEERELQELMRRTLNNPQSKLYKYLVASCFSQEMSTAQDVTYDMSVSKGRWFVSLLEEVIKKTRKVLETHGAVSLSPPLLVPCGSSPLPPTTVSVMTRWGGVVKLPHDLRLPFARFLAHNPAITQFKRYSIDRVYRERRVLGHHPRELYECAFDIVTPNTGNMVAESELLSVVWQVLNEYPSLLHNCVIRLNHTNLLRAILFHCGIEVTKHNRVCSLLAQVKEDYCSKPKVEALLSSLDLAEQTVSALMNLLDQEHTFGRAVTVLLPVLQRSNVARTLSKQAFNQLELIISSTLELGVKCPLVVSPGLVGNCNHYSSGMICQVVWEHRNKQGHNQRSIIAAGGRYDNLISTLRQMNEGSQCQGAQNAVGISLSLDKLVTTLQADQVKITPVDAVVCSVGSELMIREKLHLTRELWAAGIRTYLLDGEQNLEEIQTFCLEMNIPHIIMLKDTDIGSVRIRSWNKDRFYEKKVAQAECVDNILRLCETQNSLRPETKSVSSIITEVPTINIVFLLGEKLSSAMKRRYEYQVHSTILSITHRLSPKVRVEVIVVNMEGDVIKMLASYIEMDSYDQDLSAVIKRFPKHKKLVNRLSEQIQEMKRPMIVATIVLYGTVDNTFKVLL